MPNGVSKDLEDRPRLDRESGHVRQLSHSKETLAVNETPLDDSLTAPNQQADVEHRAIIEERDGLREEVAQVRRTLDYIRAGQEGELDVIREELSTTRSEKEQAEAQYRGLLGKVSTIRSQLGERLKADAVGLVTLKECLSAYRSAGRSLASKKSHRRSRGAMCESTGTE